ncbi:P-loop NTPase [Collinsella sp. AGMB00827]|uniref:P-loop NTPase n=1 Tax=Collinsella ureilytica TaxID=2869515 RepID=A0ABS7MIN5_9ACTN|nr:P-loop NTPase [Collinsella urealyticum]MBY4797231.1 P-loop NTPase [Collinsella urealyticum]
MAGIWAISCKPCELACVRQEVHARDAEAQLVRLASSDNVLSLIEADAGVLAGMLCSTSDLADDEAVSLIERVAKLVTCPLIVMCDRLDPGLIARLFYAGATEVVAGGSSSSCEPVSSKEACAKGALRQATSAGAVAHSKEPAKSASGMDAYAEPARQVHDRTAFHYASSMTTALDEPDGLDEPDELGRSDELEEPDEIDGLDEVASRKAMGGRSTSSEPGAPVICAIAGRGGVGTSSVVGLMAATAARMGLRTAVIDLDLMHGNLPALMGIDDPVDLARLLKDSDSVSETAIEATAMMVSPGLTLWGSLERPELAESMGTAVEQLIFALRDPADVIFIDTSVAWGDAVAAAVAMCDRCLVVGAPGPTQPESAARIAQLAARLGVARTKMVSVLNRCTASSLNEEFALRFEMALSLHSRVRIPDGGSEVSGLLSFGRLEDLARGESRLTSAIQTCTSSLLKELGCAVPEGFGKPSEQDSGGLRIRLPWDKAGEPR